DDDAVLLLGDPIDGAVEHPVEQNTGGPAAQPRVVLRRPHLKRVGLGFAARGVGYGPRAPAGRRDVLHRDLPGLYAGDHALRHEPAAAARRHRDHVLLLRPVARDVRLARGQALRTLRRVDLRGLELVVAVALRRVADRHVLEVAGRG